MTIRRQSGSGPTARLSDTIPSTRTDIVLTSAVFLLVAHHGDIDAAAEALHVRASELRIHLADLETLIGAPLLIDVQGNLLPTETGAVLIAPLRDAVQAAATADPRIGDIARALGLAGDETAPAPV